ncbi:MAG: carbohydrate kinase family protein [Actinobacteria bacterium]|nr:MAG: carbohydrate kinase family protein [Actinomycetota bacterium]
MIIASVSSGSAPPDLVVVGDVMLDVRVEAPALVTGGDVPGSVRIRPGGGGANAAVWAASGGARVVLHGAVGDDPAGHLLLGALWDRGVNAPLRRSSDRATGTMLVVSESGERSMVSDRGANAVLDERLPVTARGARALLVSGYALFDHESEAAARAILAGATSDLVAVDAASWPLLRVYGTARFLDATATANVLLLNEREAETFSPGELTGRYRDVFVKLGGGGARHGRGGRWTSVPAAEVAAPRDTTGAGDAFAGVLLARLAKGQDVRQALVAACAAGAEVARTGESWPVRPR